MNWKCGWLLSIPSVNILFHASRTSSVSWISNLTSLERGEKKCKSIGVQDFSFHFLPSKTNFIFFLRGHRHPCPRRHCLWGDRCQWRCERWEQAGGDGACAEKSQVKSTVFHTTGNGNGNDWESLLKSWEYLEMFFYLYRKLCDNWVVLLIYSNTHKLIPS